MILHIISADISSRSEGRRPERSMVSKFVGPKARAELSRANSIYVSFIEGVCAVAWQQCKGSLNDVRQREGC